MSGFGHNMAGRTAFVTGGDGMLGGWLVRALLDLGARVVVLRRPGAGRSSLLALEGLEERCVVVHGDVCDPGLLTRAIAEHECDTVFHLAAQTIVSSATRSPAATFESNMRGTWLLMEACRALDVRRVVVAASINAYGDNGSLPYLEGQPMRPLFPYDVSKACADLIARSYWHTFGVPVATTRLGSVYGGGDTNTSRLVPEVVAAVIRGRSPVIRSDGLTERDFIYVEDAVQAYLALADALDADGERPHAAARARGETFNAGSDRPRKILDVVDMICRVAGSHVRAQVNGSGTPDREIGRQFVDSTRLRDATGWAPSVSLEDGVSRTLDWYRTHTGALPA